MSYEPTNWKSGDVVTSQKLNKMEAGIAGAGGVTIIRVNITQSGNSTTYALDKTYAEIEAAYKAGPIFCELPPEISGGFMNSWDMLVDAGLDPVENKYIVAALSADTFFIAETKNDYPSTTKSTSSGPN